MHMADLSGGAPGRAGRLGGDGVSERDVPGAHGHLRRPCRGGGLDGETLISQAISHGGKRRAQQPLPDMLHA